MRLVLKWVLCAFIGVVGGFFLMLISESIFTIGACLTVAGIVSLICYYSLLQNNNLKLPISIMLFIVVFISYFALCGFLEEKSGYGRSGFWDFLMLIVYFCPYVLFSFAIVSYYEEENAKKNDNNKK